MCLPIFNQISLINMSILTDGVKILVPVAAPLIGLGSAAVKLGAMTCTGPLGGLTCAVGFIAEECTPPAVYISGKRVTALASYVRGTIICNPVWFGAGTSILTSIK